MKKKSQKQRVLEALKQGQLNNVDAIKHMKILRLSERIRENIADGWKIETVRLTDNKGRTLSHVGYKLST